MCIYERERGCMYVKSKMMNWLVRRVLVASLFSEARPHWLCGRPNLLSDYNCSFWCFLLWPWVGCCFFRLFFAYYLKWLRNPALQVCQANGAIAGFILLLFIKCRSRALLLLLLMFWVYWVMLCYLWALLFTSPFCLSYSACFSRYCTIIHYTSFL